MKRLRLASWLLLGCALAGLAAWSVFHQAEPHYQGRSLTQWLAVYQVAPTGGPAEQQAAEAIRHMGTNALPFLLERLRYRTPRWRTVVAGAANHLPEPLSRWWLVLVLGSEDRFMAATSGFEVLGPAVTPAVPELMDMLKDKEGWDLAVLAIESAGESALPRLLPVLADRSNPPRVRAGVAQALGAVGTNSTAAVKLLVACLDDDVNVARQSAAALGRLAIQPELAIPALSKAVQNPSHNVREPALWALGQFGDKARPALPELEGALQDAEPKVRMAATNALRTIAPELLPKQSEGDGKKE